MDRHVTEGSMFQDWSDITISPNTTCPNNTADDPYHSEPWKAVEITMWCVLGGSIVFR